MDSIRIQARFVIVSPTRILHRGQVVIARGRITEVTESIHQTADVDLGDSILLPGLINCHTHLEFSHLTEPIAAGATFPEWIGAVVRYRRQQAKSLSEVDQVHRLTSAVAAGARECFLTGTCLIADIVTPPWTPESIPAPEAFVAASVPEIAQLHAVFAPCRITSKDWGTHFGPVSFPRIIACPEVIGLDAARFDQSLHWAGQLAATDLSRVSPVLCGVGISPHAPYSLWQLGMARLTESQFTTTMLMAMHIAESLDEREWASAGAGAFRAAFEQLGVPVSNGRVQIDDAIRLLQSAKRSLVVHGNYLNDQEIAAIATAPQVSVVMCPRTHEHFGHALYPLNALQQQGVNVVLGTDSRASNPDLNIWSEMQEARRKHPTLNASMAFSSITSRAAHALGCQREFGTLEVGKLAYMNVLGMYRDIEMQDLMEAITCPDKHLSKEKMRILPLAAVLHPANLA